MIRIFIIFILGAVAGGVAVWLFSGTWRSWKKKAACGKSERRENMFTTNAFNGSTASSLSR